MYVTFKVTDVPIICECHLSHIYGINKVFVNRLNTLSTRGNAVTEKYGDIISLRGRGGMGRDFTAMGCGLGHFSREWGGDGESPCGDGVEEDPLSVKAPSFEARTSPGTLRAEAWI